MRINTGISSCASQVFILFILDVLVSFTISVSLGKTEIDDMYNVWFLSKTHEEILGLYISVNIILGMQTSDSTKLKFWISNYFFTI